MTANINAAPKNNPFTLIYRDKENGEIYTHQFLHHEEEVYGEELSQFLLLPATESWMEIFKGPVDFEQVEAYAESLEVLAVVFGHANVETPCKKGVNWNPKLDIFGKPQLRLV
jgi:hypothetical protein